MVNNITLLFLTINFFLVKKIIFNKKLKINHYMSVGVL